MFRTILDIPEIQISLDHKTPIFLIGSCFSDNIGKKLHEFKFDASVNPFGTVYNPYSINKLLTYAIDGNYPDESSYLVYEELHANYDFHSSFSALSAERVKKHIESEIDKASKFLKTAHTLVITWGTSYVYERNDTQEIVSNCHKLPAERFTKKLLTQKQIIDSFDDLYKKLKDFNKDLNIVLTVSPVRHIKDSLPKNSVSKSILRISCETLTEQYDNVNYFPTYEFMMDDLRDYRFYEADMIHPSEVAKDYLWNCFYQCFCNMETQLTIKKWKKIKRAIDHIPFNSSSSKHQEFLKETIKKLLTLENTLDVSEEIKTLEAQLIA